MKKDNPALATIHHQLTVWCYRPGNLLYRNSTGASIGRGPVWALLSGHQSASIIDKHAADMAMLNLVINSRVVNSSGGLVVCNAIFTATGALIRRLQIQPEALHRP